MKTIRKISLAIIALLSFSSVFSQNSQVRDVSNFTSMDVSEGIYVELSMGDKEYVEVITDEDLIDKVVTEIKGSELNIYIKGNNIRIKNKEIIVKVTATVLNSIEASSGSSVISQNLIESDELELSSSSGATLKIAFKAPKSSCDASSGASANLKGATKFFKTKASSGSSIKAKDLIAVNVSAGASSGAHISLHAEEELSADASSGGSINYSGSPKIVDIDKSSGGSVNRK